MKRISRCLGFAIAIACLFPDRASANNPPTADAGRDTAFILGLSFSLRSQATDDSLSLWDLIYAWTQIGGPNPGAEILAPQSRNSAVKFSQPGEYLFELTVSDGTLSTKDSVKVVVRPMIPFRVLKPDTGDIIYTGNHYIITWQVYPPTGMHVFLSTNDGLTYDRLNETKVELTDTFFVWDVPDTLPESDECIIMVSEYGHYEIVTYSGVFHLRKGPQNARVPLRMRGNPAGDGTVSRFSTNGRHLNHAGALPTAGHTIPSIGVVRSADGGKTVSSRKALIAQ